MLPFGVRYPTVLFDFDGTLVDSVRLIVESFHHTMRVHGHEPRPDAFWIAGLGTPLRVVFRAFTDDAAVVQRMIATYREWNFAHHDAMVRAYPGALEAVRAVQRRGSRLGIVTSKNRDGLERGLALCGFDGLFDELVTSDDLEASKPSPEPVLLALERLGASPGRTLFVGDSPHDIAAGRDAGTETAACLWGPFSREQIAAERPHHWLSSFADLTCLVDGGALPS
ncbi:MAG: HAD-IA family hydrolase [Gemmatimonadota bacterium]